MNNHSTFLKKSNSNTEFEKNKFIEEYVNKGISIIPVNDNKLPYIQWKPYQDKLPEPEEIYSWYFDYPGFNVGIVTGGISNFYSLDFDTYEAFKVFPDEYKNSALTKTKRGLHLNFLSERNYPGKILNIKDYKVEFKGMGQYVIEPYANIQGFEYKVINPLSMIKNIPHFIEDLLRDEKFEKLQKSEPQNIAWKYNGKQACIKQILSKGIEEGERERTLFILYSLLIRNRNSEKYAQSMIIKKNNLLKNSLPEKEIMNIFKKDYNHLGCGYIRSNLPWIRCAGCEYLKEVIVKMDFRKMLFDSRLTEKDKQIAFELYIEDKNDKTEIAKSVKGTRLQVYRSIERLKKAGYL